MTRNNQSRDIAFWNDVKEKWNNMGSFFDDMDRKMDNLIAGHGISLLSSDSQSLFLPKIDMEQTKDNLTITAEIPGIEKEDVKVQIEDSILTIFGEKKYETSDTKNNDGLIFSERSYGSFKRQVQLPKNISEDSVDASYKDGVLKLVFKLEEPKNKLKSIELN